MYIQQVPLFRETDDIFLKQLALRAQAYTFCPGDTIIYSGDMGREMYCIRRGKCDVSTCMLLQYC